MLLVVVVCRHLHVDTEVLVWPQPDEAAHKEVL